MVSIRIQLIPTLVLVLSMAAWGAPQVTVAVRPTSDVAGANVTLGDIASSIAGADAKVADQIKAVTVCTSPLPGKTRKLSDDQITIALKRAGLFENTGLLCPPEVSVARTSATVGSADLIEAARKHILASSTWTGTVSVESALKLSDQVVPSGKLDLRVKAGTNAVRKGRNSVSVEIVVDDKVYRTMQVSVNVKLVAPVAVALKPIARNEQISANNVAIQERDITMLPDDILTVMPETGWTADLAISEGSILRKSWVAAPPAVLSGDQVLVVVSNGSITLTEKGVAAQDGCVGDRIKVRLSGEGRDVRGTVEGPGLVQITIGRRK